MESQRNKITTLTNKCDELQRQLASVHTKMEQKQAELKDAHRQIEILNGNWIQEKRVMEGER